MTARGGIVMLRISQLTDEQVRAIYLDILRRVPPADIAASHQISAGMVGRIDRATRGWTNDPAASAIVARMRAGAITRSVTS